MYNLQDVTFIIPIYPDTNERIENLMLCLEYIYRHFDTNIIVCERNKTETIKKYTNHINTRYIFLQSDVEYYHKTKVLNLMIKEATTNIICAIDVDCMIYPENINMAVNLIRNDQLDVILPYDMKHYDVQRRFYKEIIKNFDLKSLNTNEIGRAHV